MSIIEVRDLVFLSESAHRILDRINISVGEGEKLAVIGPNGSGKSTFLRLLAGQIRPSSGNVKVSELVRLVDQEYVSGRVLDIVLSPHEQLLKELYEVVLKGSEDSHHFLRVLELWDDLDGYSLQTEWDELSLETCGVPFGEIALRNVERLSGGERKLLALRAALSGREGVLLFDEPESSLDIDGRDFIEREISNSAKTIIFCSHDRQLLTNYSGRFLVFEPRRNGTVCWDFAGNFEDFSSEQQGRIDRIATLQERQKSERSRLEEYSDNMSHRASYNDKMSSRSRSAKRRLERFDDNRTEIYKREHRPPTFTFGSSVRRYAFFASILSERRKGKALSMVLSPGVHVGLVGRSGAGKSTFLAMIARQFGAEDDIDRQCRMAVKAKAKEVTSTGLPPKVGIFSQDSLRKEFLGCTVLEIAADRLRSADSLGVDDLPRVLNRSGVAHLGKKRYEDLSGGERARVQLMVLSLSEFDLLLLDEPTENLDIDATDALQRAISEYSGCVIVASHDRKLLDSLDQVFRLEV